MPRPHTLKIAEIFASFQGEGLRQGEPSLFIRLSGCNLRCRFCDTPEAWETGRAMSIERIMDEVAERHRDYPAAWVCLTGGEPLLQNIDPLLEALKNAAFRIQIETNGTQAPAGGRVDWYTVSPKPPDYRVHPEFRRLAREVKLIVSRELELNIVRKVRKAFPRKTPLILQPESRRPGSMQKSVRLLGQALQAGEKNLRVSVQLHKIYGVL